MAGHPPQQKELFVMPLPRTARFALVCVLGLLAFSQAGCNLVPRRQLSQAQLHTQQMYGQNRSLAQAQSQLAADNARLQQQVNELTASRDLLQQRLANAQGESSELRAKYAGLLKNKSPLSGDATRAFEELQRKYPDFEFDPQTGVSKLASDLLFASGSAEINESALPRLRDIANILNRGDSQELNILVVGHTDDTRVVKPNTKAQHLDNWGLSTHRANAVLRALARDGIKEKRMGSAGYGPHQPIVQNSSEANRAKNRRVEIFVLAPNASLAGWENDLRR
jgi:chemotaxis protein MotB